MLRKLLAVVCFLTFGFLILSSGIVYAKVEGLKGFAIWVIMVIGASVLLGVGSNLWKHKQPQSFSVEWNLIKNHLSLEGLNVIIDTYPEIQEEAGEVAKEKRFMARLSEPMHHFPLKE